MSSAEVDVAVVGAGAAGLAAAAFVARRAPRLRVTVLDGARRLGAKILISGGGRCNLTNRHVSAGDYWGGDRRVIASVLRAFPVSRTLSFFEELGVSLHEEERGKLFPDTNQARTVLDSLLRELAGLDVAIRAGVSVAGVSLDTAEEPEPRGVEWRLATSAGSIGARRLVLATGGLSLPKTGSDGRGLSMARSLGHTIVPTTPALVPLLLGGTFHRRLSGVSHDADLAVLADGRLHARVRGPLLWTHFGVSGPLALDASRHWLRVQLEGRRPEGRLSFVPGMDFADVERSLVAAAGGAGGARTARALLAGWLPAAVAEAILEALALDGAQPLSQLARDDRRRLTHALTAWELPIMGSRGYNYAEATAGGVALDEVDRRTMESTRHAGLYLVGEMLDVDGRLGGYNFQWAWSSAWVAAQAIARSLAPPRPSSPVPLPRERISRVRP